MAQNGWERLGEALAGASPARQAEIRQKTIDALARTDYNLARSREAVQGQVKRESLGDTFAQIMADNPNARAYADAQLAGVNLNELTNATGNIQEQGFRGGARDRAVAGDLAGANAELFGVASGPVQIPTVEGNTLISNRLVPGGGTTAPTAVGDSMVSKNLAQGQAALIRANRPPASRGGGSGAAPRLSEIDKMRLQAAMKDLEPMMKAAQNEIIANQGASSPRAQQRLADAQTRLAQLQQQRDEMLNMYGGTPPAPPAATPAPRQGGNLPSFLRYQGPAAGTVSAPGAGGAPQQIATKAQFDRLPSGTQFIAPDGSVRVKP